MTYPLVSPCGGGISTGSTAQLFQLVFQTLLNAQCNISPPESWPKDYAPIALQKGFQKFNYIVIGSSSAGSVVANRLSENPDCSVLLIEVGSNPPQESAIPAQAHELQDSVVFWNNYVVKTNKAGLAFPKGIRFTDEKLLGGDSATANLLYMRGNSRDYDRWSKNGNPDWCWDSVLPYFKKSEGNQDLKRPNSKLNPKYHNCDGLLSVDYFNQVDNAKEILYKAAKELGYKNISDINANEYIGFALGQGTIKCGQRYSAGQAFLGTAKNRTNLYVLKNSYVKKINFDAKKQAKSVTVIFNYEDYKIEVKNEIIVSCNSIQSPKLLISSGIGPAPQLKKFGIPQIADLPVGKNLQDHIAVPFFIAIENSKKSKDELMDQVYAVIDFALKRSGPLTSTAAGDFIGLLNTKDSCAKFPDIQISALLIKARDPLYINIIKKSGYQKAIIDKLLKAHEKNDIYMLEVILLNPESCGEVRLRSSDPNDVPIIDARYLESKNDLKTLVRGLRIVESLLKTKVMVSKKAQQIILPLPACDSKKVCTTSYWECYVRHLANTKQHPAGTNKMGNNGVVDSRLRVKGIKGLRVVDDSIMPNIPSGNTNTPSIMIGEKASDMIKADNFNCCLDRNPKAPRIPSYKCK